jgi:hypothetical protein
MRDVFIQPDRLSRGLENAAALGDDDRAREASFQIRERPREFVYRGELPEQCARVHVFKCIAARAALLEWAWSFP